MRHALEIPDTEPFKNDKLDREKYADILTRLLETYSTPFVLSLDAAWGYGKTTFVKMWVQKLRLQGKHCVYYSAWESDYSEDPLSSIVTELKQSLEAQYKGNEEKSDVKKNLETIGHAATKIAVRSLPAVIKLLTAGLIDAKGINADIKEAISETISDVTQSSIDVVKEHESRKEAVREFKQILQELVVALRPEGESETSTVLTIIIDELDRCRPPYAITTLERIKHLFDVQGIAFIIVFHKEQVHNSLETMYGPKVDAANYLKRIIDLQYRLPEPSREQFVDFLIEKHELHEFFKTRYEVVPERANELLLFRDIAALIAVHNELSLRDIEQLFSLVNLVIRAQKDQHDYPPEVFLILAALKLNNPKSYLEMASDYGDGAAVRKLVVKTGGKAHALQPNLLPIIDMITHFWLSSEEPNSYFREIKNKVEIEGTMSQAIKTAYEWRRARSALKKQNRQWYIARLDLMEGFQSNPPQP